MTPTRLPAAGVFPTSSPAAGHQPPLFRLATTKPAAKSTRRRRVRRTVAADAPTTYTAGADEQGRWQWTLTFPAPDRMLSINGNVHWRTRHALTTSWREALVVHAKAARLPHGLAKVRLDFELRFPDARADRDAANYHALTVKPATDGLGPPFQQKITRGKRAGQVNHQPGYGLIPDDTPQHLDGPHLRIGPKVADPKRCPYGQVVLTITDLTGETG